MKTHLAQALAAFLPAKQQTATAFAKAVGVHQVTISRLCTGDRPAVETLKAICTRWPDHRATLGLLVAHLRDEIERAGRSPTEVEIVAESVETDDIHLLAKAAAEDEDLRAILHDFARMIRNTQAKQRASLTYPEAATGDLEAAAPPPPIYGAARDALQAKADAEAAKQSKPAPGNTP